MCFPAVNDYPWDSQQGPPVTGNICCRVPQGAEDGLFLAFCLFGQVHCLPEVPPRRHCTHIHTPTRSFETESRGPSIPHRLLCKARLCRRPFLPSPCSQLLKAMLRSDKRSHPSVGLGNTGIAVPSQTVGLINPASSFWQQPPTLHALEECHSPFRTSRMHLASHARPAAVHG